MDLNHKKKDYLIKIKEKYQIQNFYKVYKKIYNSTIQINLMIFIISMNILKFFINYKDSVPGPGYYNSDLINY